MKEERFFYNPNVLSSDSLPEDEAAHAIRVLRLGVNDKIWIMDGKGTFYNALITETSKKICKYRIIDSYKQEKDWNAYLHVAVAPTKNIDRMEWFVEKAVEIGVDEITFLNTDFTERKKINIDRMNKIMVAAMKQSRKPYITILNDLTDFSFFINNVKQKNRFICHCYDNNNEVDLNEKCLFKDVVNGLDEVIVMIGPEGDFSVKEVLNTQELGFRPVSLGKSRLRTETAALSAVHIMNIFNS